MLSSNKG